MSAGNVALMMRLRVQWVGLMSLVFVLPIAFIRAHPLDGSALQAFFTQSAGCLAPCFLGVHPGQTTVSDAITLLQAHPWVEDIIVSDEFDRLIVIWSATDQPFIDPDSLGRFRFHNNIIQDINVRTHIALGDVWVNFGRADWARRAPAGINRPPGTSYWVWYDRALPNFVFFVPEGKGLNQYNDLLHAPLTLAYGPAGNNALIAAPTLKQLWHGIRRSRPMIQ